MHGKSTLQRSRLVRCPPGRCLLAAGVLALAQPVYASDCDLVTKAEAAALVGKPVRDGIDIPSIGCQYYVFGAPNDLEFVAVRSDRFETPDVARNAFQMLAGRQGAQDIPNLGDGARLVTERSSIDITVLKGRVKVFIQVAGAKLDDPKLAMTRAAAAALSRVK
ncbi:MAG TPA: hypothetical protein VNZ26_18070 [Vicinamibacterales bacterium]|nr:hypothetical protein [Vicinamibacterales bacterium]